MKYLIIVIVLAGAVFEVPAAVPALLVSGREEPRETRIFACGDWDLKVLKPAEAGAPDGLSPRPEVVLLLDGCRSALNGHEAEWREWLEQGGILVVSSYDAGLVASAAAIAPEAGAVVAQYCLMNADKGMELDNAFAANAPLQFPNRVAEHFRRRSGGWKQGHLTAAAGWARWIECPQGEGLMISRKIGRGLLVLTSWVQLAGHGSRPEACSGLLSNLLAWRDLEAAGLQVEEFSAPDQFGDHTLTLTLRNVSSQSLELDGVLSLTVTDPDAQYAYPLSGRLEPGEALTLQETIRPVRSGRISGSLQLNQPAGYCWQWRTRVPDPVLCQAGTPRFSSDQLAAAPFRLEVAEQIADEGLYRVEILIDGRVVDYEVKNSRIALLDLSELAVGDHELRWRLLELPPEPGFMAELIVAEGRSEPFSVVAKAPGVFVDSEGFICKNGERILPIGFYTVSWSNPEPRRDALLDFSIANGLNLIHASFNADHDEFGPFLEKAKAHGINVILEGTGFNQIQKLKRYDNILAWNIVDEPDLHATPVESLMPRRRELGNADAGRPVYTVIVAPDAFEEYRPIADIVANDYYSFNFDGGLGAYAPVIRKLTETLAGTMQAPFAVLWCYGYGPGDLPTPAQLRSQFYQVLGAGAKGILFYTWNDYRPFYLPDTPGIAEAGAQLAGEGAALEEFILHGDRHEWRFEPLSGKMAAEWRLPDGRTLVVLTNADPREAAGFELEGDFPALEELFVPESRKRLTPQGTRLKLTLAPLESVVLRSR